MKDRFPKGLSLEEEVEMGHFLYDVQRDLATCKSWLWRKNQSFLHNALGHFLGYGSSIFNHLFKQRSGFKIIVLGTKKNEAFSLASFSLLFVEWAFSLRSGHLNLASTSKFHGTKSNKNGMVFVTFCCFSFFMLSRANLIFLDLQSSANNNVLPSYKKMFEVWHGSFIVF